MNGSVSPESADAVASFTLVGILPYSSSFGMAWQDEVYGIGVVVLSVTDLMVKEIKTYPRSDPYRPLRRNQLVTDEWHRTIELIAGEFITALSVRRNARDEVVGLQFETNKRVTPWFGCPMGVVDRFAAPHGWCISSLMGRFRYLSPDEPICELGCRFDRILSQQSLEHNQKLEPARNFRKSGEINFHDPDAVDRRFYFAHTDLHTLVFAFGQGVKRLSGLSVGQFERYFKRWESPFAWNETAISLMEGEHFTGAEIAHSNGTFAVRLDTNVRSTSWFGRAVSKDDKLTKLQPSGDSTDARICGFFGSLTRDDRICSIGAVFSPEIDEDAAVPALL